MSTDQPGPGSPDDPFAKRPQDGGSGTPGGSPYDPPPGEQPPPDGPYGGGPYGSPPPGAGAGWQGQSPYDQGPGQGQGPYDQGPGGPDPLAGMPPLATPGRRVLARIIDLVIVLIPSYLLEWASVGGSGSDFSTGRSAVGGVFTAGIGFLYEWYLTKSTGQTVGKRTMGLRAAMLDNGSVPSSSAAAVRALVLWVPAFCCSCFWFVIIGITVYFDKPYKQGLHDKAAKTVVVQAA